MSHADIDDASASTLADATEKAGLRRYLWLYFFVVPLAAVSASTVAIIIAALQGLEGHEHASRLFALIVMVGLKFVAAIAVSYLIAVGLALFSVFFISYIRSGRAPSRKSFFQDQLLIVTSLIYGGTILAYSTYKYIWSDIRNGWEILAKIAGS